MYTINFTDSTKPSITIQDYGRNGPREKESSTSLTLLGKGSEDYGDELWTNLVHLLENFCSGGDIGPSNPTEGQLWFNTKDNTLKVWKRKPLSGIILPASNKTYALGDNVDISPITSNPPNTSTVSNALGDNVDISPITTNPPNYTPNNPNSIEYYWESLIDGSKYGDNTPTGILKTLMDGFKEPISDEAKALLKLLEKYFLSINGGTLTGDGKLYINALTYNSDTVITDYTNNKESTRAVNAGFLVEYVNDFVKKYLSSFGFDTSAFGKDLDSGNGSTSSIEYLPLELSADPTEVSGNNLKLTTNVEFSKAAKLSTIPTIDDHIVNKKYADSIFTPETLLIKIKDTNVTAYIKTLVPSGTSPVDYNTLATALSTNTAFITAVANMIKNDPVFTNLNISTIDAEIEKYNARGSGIIDVPLVKVR
jgi:hypothetical protein